LRKIKKIFSKTNVTQNMIKTIFRIERTQHVHYLKCTPPCVRSLTYIFKSMYVKDRTHGVYIKEALIKIAKLTKLS